MITKQKSAGGGCTAPIADGLVCTTGHGVQTLDVIEAQTVGKPATTADASIWFPLPTLGISPKTQGTARAPKEAQ